MRRRLSLSAALAALPLLLLAAPAGAVEVGVVETLGQTKPTAQTAAELGAGWVRLWATWEGAQPSGPGAWDADALHNANLAVSQAKARGLKVLMVVQRSPAWASGGQGGIHPPTDPVTFGAAMGGFARQVPGVDAWELWNEEDAHMFWAGGADPARYAAMVKAAYPAIKAVQPHDVVVTGATTGNNMDFVADLYDHGIKGSFDAVGVHTDTACLVNGPGEYYRDERGRIGRYTFSAFREVHAVMARHGDGNKPIWMTELGWGTESTAPGSCNVGRWAGQKPLGVTEAQQAAFLSEAFACLAADPAIGVAFWFGLQDMPGSRYPGGFGLFRRDSSAKPSAAAFKALAGGIAPVPCGGVVDASGPRIEIAKPYEGERFTRELAIDARGVDSPGGVGIARMKLYVDGRFERTFGDGRARMSPLWSSRTWKLGRHTLTFKAIDEAHNVVSRSVTVRRVRRLPKVATSATLALEQLDPATVKATGGVSSPTAHATVKPRGKAFLVFQRRVAARHGRRAWRTVHRIGRRASRAVDVTQRLGRGTWRVFLHYPGRPGFKTSRSRPQRLLVP